MIELARDNAQQAKGMLTGKFSTPLGKVVKRIIHVHYYIVDGKLWSWDDDGNVCRCDDPEEQEKIMRFVRSEAVQDE